MLREIVGGTWKKEDELKLLKSEVMGLERKIQLSLAPPRQSDKGNTEQKQEGKTASCHPERKESHREIK